MTDIFEPPCPFLEHPGAPPLPWRTWYRMFCTYMDAAFATMPPNTRRRAILLNCLGTEGQRIFYTLPSKEETYESAVRTLEEFFLSKVNVCAERHRFRRRVQLPTEPIDRFLVDLRKLVIFCEYGQLEEEMIRDQIIEGTNSVPLRKRLLAEDGLTLDKAVLIARQMENVENDSDSEDVYERNLESADIISASATCIEQQQVSSRRSATESEYNDASFRAEPSRASTRLRDALKRKKENKMKRKNRESKAERASEKGSPKLTRGKPQKLFVLDSVKLGKRSDDEKVKEKLATKVSQIRSHPIKMKVPSDGDLSVASAESMLTRELFETLAGKIENVEEMVCEVKISSDQQIKELQQEISGLTNKINELLSVPATLQETKTNMPVTAAESFAEKIKGTLKGWQDENRAALRDMEKSIDVLKSSFVAVIKDAGKEVSPAITTVERVDMSELKSELKQMHQYVRSPKIGMQEIKLNSTSIWMLVLKDDIKRYLLHNDIDGALVRTFEQIQDLEKEQGKEFPDQSVYKGHTMLCS
uniref:Retrotransposon gag domain-containing protein n=1 Tax=Trichuris muris TaxID=70415 RepID=A0A5S6QVH7_TRIMR